jgi:hypothetical protein
MPLRDGIGLIVNEQPLPYEHRNHQLHNIAHYLVLYYIEFMDPEIVFVLSAFKHGVTRDDIIHAYKTIIRAGPIERYGNKYGFIGFNRAGNPIEVFYNPIGESAIKVFHAMDCRDGIFDQIEP